MVAERLKGLDGDRLFKHFHLVEALGITPEPSKLAPDIDTGSTFALCKTQRQTTISKPKPFIYHSVYWFT